MPELLEIEAYRGLFEDRALARPIAAVEAPDAWYLKEGLDARTLADALVGGQFVAARRHGKLLIADLADRPSVGLRFGMTGRLVVDEHQALDRLEHGSSRHEPTWDRLVVRFADGGDLRMHDPRRLGGVNLEPDLERLGPDAAALTLSATRAIARPSRAPVKALLMDQSRVAGLGNLLVDEALWRAGIDPTRAAKSLSDDEVATMHRAIRTTLTTLGRRGGSHTGDLQPQRREGGLCPKDGEPLRRRQVGGRTTYSCPRHQR